MNSIELSQYILDEFTRIEEKAVSAERSRKPLESIIHLDNGKSLAVNGLMAVRLNESLAIEKAQKEQMVKT